MSDAIRARRLSEAQFADALAYLGSLPERRQQKPHRPTRLEGENSAIKFAEILTEARKMHSDELTYEKLSALLGMKDHTTLYKQIQDNAFRNCTAAGFYSTSMITLGVSP